jgi:glycosyltransferase involved in cell wall biosynthesis
MEKISLIMRVYNRLEYTIETLSNIINNTDYDNYEIIIIDNDSKDGTTEWLKWVQVNSPFYKDKFKHFVMTENLGDWYGMVEGLKHVSNDSKYIVQIDNDIKIDDSKWLKKLLYVLENTNTNIVMLKRIGVINNLPTNNDKTLMFENEKLEIGNINRPVCCYIISEENFKNFTIKYNGIQGKDSKHLLGREFKNITKIKNVKCHVHLNNGKYMFNNKNVWEKI